MTDYYYCTQTITGVGSTGLITTTGNALPTIGSCGGAASSVQANINTTGDSIFISTIVNTGAFSKVAGGSHNACASGTCGVNGKNIAANIEIQAGATVGANAFTGEIFDGTLTISGGTIDPTAFGVTANPCSFNGVVTISSGAFSATTNVAFQKATFNNNVFISGGTFSSTSGANNAFNTATFNNPVLISGSPSFSAGTGANATFGSSIFNITSATLTITGGTFSSTSGATSAFQSATLKGNVSISGASTEFTSSSTNSSFKNANLNSTAALSISDAKFSSSAGANNNFDGLTNTTSLTITSATFSGSTGMSSFDTSTIWNGPVSITGSSFTTGGTNSAFNGDTFNSTLTISNSTFSAVGNNAFKSASLKGNVMISGATTEFSATGGNSAFQLANFNSTASLSITDAKFSASAGNNAFQTMSNGTSLTITNAIFSAGTGSNVAFQNSSFTGAIIISGASTSFFSTSNGNNAFSGTNLNSTATLSISDAKFLAPGGSNGSFASLTNTTSLTITSATFSANTTNTSFDSSTIWTGPVAITGSAFNAGATNSPFRLDTFNNILTITNSTFDAATVSTANNNNAFSGATFQNAVTIESNTKFTVDAVNAINAGDNNAFSGFSGAVSFGASAPLHITGGTFSTTNGNNNSFSKAGTVNTITFNNTVKIDDTTGVTTFLAAGSLKNNIAFSDAIFKNAVEIDTTSTNGTSFTAPSGNNNAFQNADFQILSVSTLKILGTSSTEKVIFSANTDLNVFKSLVTAQSLDITFADFIATNGVNSAFDLTAWLGVVNIISGNFTSALDMDVYQGDVFQDDLKITGSNFSSSGSANNAFSGAQFNTTAFTNGVTITDSVFEVTGGSLDNNAFSGGTFNQLVTINNGVTRFSSVNNNYVFSGASGTATFSAPLHITGGTFSATNNNYAFAAYDNPATYTEVRISGGTFSGTNVVNIFGKGGAATSGAAITVGLCISSGTFSACSFGNLALSGYLSISGGTFTGTSACPDGFFTVNTIDPGLTVCIQKNVSYLSNMFISNNGCLGIPTTHTLCPYIASSSNGTDITCVSNSCCPGAPCPTLKTKCCCSPTPLLSKTAQTNILCFGASTGSVTIAASSGTTTPLGNNCTSSCSADICNDVAGCYCYTLSGPTSTTPQCVGSSAIFSNLSAGIYIASATDDSGCVGTINVELTQLSAVSPVCTHVNVSANGLTPGSVTVTVSGGTAGACACDVTTACADGYCVVLKNSANVIVGTLCACNPSYSVTFPGLSGDTYTATVTDSNGCVGTCSTTVLAPVNRGGTSPAKVLATTLKLPPDIQIWTLETDPPANPILGGGVPLICCTASTNNLECNVFDFTSITAAGVTTGNAAGLVCGGNIDCTGCPGGTQAIVSCFDIGIKTYDFKRRCWTLHALGEIGDTIDRPCTLILTAGSWTPTVSSVDDCPLITPSVVGGTVKVEILTGLNAIINCFVSCNGLCTVDNDAALIPDTLVDVAILNYAFYKGDFCNHYFDLDGNAINSGFEFINALLNGDTLVFNCTPDSSSICGCTNSGANAMTINLCNFPCLAPRLVSFEKIQALTNGFNKPKVKFPNSWNDFGL